MTDKTYPVVGQKIILLEDIGDGIKREYTSQILEINNEKRIIMAVPIQRSHFVTILEGTCLTAIYNMDDRGVYEFKTKVIRIEKNKIPQMIVEKISPIVKNQRRDYFRLNLTVPVKLKKDDSDVLDIAHSKDISGGGIRLVSSFDLRINDTIYVEFVLNNKKYRLTGKVVRTFPKLDKKQEVAIKYLDIVEIDRNDIIRYLFQQQRILIKRGI